MCNPQKQERKQPEKKRGWRRNNYHSKGNMEKNPQKVSAGNRAQAGVTATGCFRRWTTWQIATKVGTLSIGL